MTKKVRPKSSSGTKRRRFTGEFRREAVQMMLDGHSAASVAQRLGISSPTLLYRWRQQQLSQGGPVASSLGALSGRAFARLDEADCSKK
jgi:transposase-like protein